MIRSVIYIFCAKLQLFCNANAKAQYTLFIFLFLGKYTEKNMEIKSAKINFFLKEMLLEKRYGKIIFTQRFFRSTCDKGKWLNHNILISGCCWD